MSLASSAASSAASSGTACCSSRMRDRKSTRLNSSHSLIAYAVFCLKKNRSFLLRYLADVAAAYARARQWQIGDQPPSRLVILATGKRLNSQSCVVPRLHVEEILLA